MIAEADFWSGVSAIAGCLATIAALIALNRAAVARTEERKIRRLNRRDERLHRERLRKQEYYASYVQGPVCLALDAFVKQVFEIGDEAKSEVSEYYATGEEPDTIRERVKQAIRQSKGEWQRLWDTVSVGLEGFGDQKLREALRERMETLEQRYTEEFARLGEAGEFELRETVRSEASMIRRLLMAHDPGIARGPTGI